MVKSSKESFVKLHPEDNEYYDQPVKATPLDSSKLYINMEKEPGEGSSHLNFEEKPKNIKNRFL